MPRDIYEDIDRTLISTKELQARVEELAQQIMADYAEKDDLLLLGVLKGSVMFMTDLSRMIRRPHQLDFMAVSSYGSGTESSGVVQIRMDLRESITGKNVLIVEDIVDSGRTLRYLINLLQTRQPASMKVCTLLDKPDRRLVDVSADYTGFEIPDEFVVGYGLDFDELYRNIPYIAILKPEAFGGAEPE